MSQLRVVSSTQMCSFLEHEGFSNVRQKGSHRFYRHPDGRTTIVPMHTTDLDRSLIRKIIKDIDVSVDDFNNRV